MHIRIGSIVKIFDEELGEEYTYRIVSGNREESADLSIDSALGKALIYKRVGDIVTVRAEEEYTVEIISIDNSNVIIPSITPNNTRSNKLVRNLYKGYGTRAQPIYDECCKKFGWDSSKRGLFAPQKPLYALKATPEGYSPLFLAHSNWTESKGGNWTNTITPTTIEEKWDTLDYVFYQDQCTRVVFAKTKHCNYNYVFLGLYKPVAHREETLPNGKTRWIKIFEKISDEYNPTNV